MMDRSSFLRLFASTGIALLSSPDSRAALVPPYFMFCVVALGGPTPEIRDNSQLRQGRFHLEAKDVALQVVIRTPIWIETERPRHQFVGPLEIAFRVPGNTTLRPRLR
jgi:hypothetical protein